ncbi:MAG: glycosyltransferase family 9 protein [Caldilineales bacterium]|nr:glycosyltransferase family 9 protein [Caldilineales bacterium]
MTDSSSNLQPKRILAIKLADLGDVLNVTPALRALRESFPLVQIDLLVNPHTAALLAGSQLIDHVIELPKTSFEGGRVFHPASWLPLIKYVRSLRAQEYDTVINFHHLTTPLGRAKQQILITATGARATVGLDNGHGRWFSHPVADAGFGAKREVEYWLDLAQTLGASSSDTSLDLPVSVDDEREVADILARHGLASQPFVVMHPGSGGFSLARRWDAPKFAALAAEIERRHGIASVLVGTADDNVPAVIAAAASPIVDLSSQLSLKQLAALLGQAALFVGADSGVMHMAAAMRTPIVAIFGPTNHLAWAPWTPHSPSRVVRLGISCSPCAYVNHSVAWRNGCPERACLADLAVDHVLMACEELLSGD